VKPNPSLDDLRNGDDPALFDLAEEMAARLQSGGAADLEAWIAAQGGYADRLRRLLPTVQAMAALASADGSAPAAGPEGAAVPGVLGDFRILREVGRGGMGVVYEAEQVSLSRKVALKILPLAATLDPRRLQRFQNEARAAACLHHTNIVPVYAVGREQGISFYAMQLIEGQTLAAVLTEFRQHEEGKEVGSPQGPGAQADRAAGPSAEVTTAYRPPPGAAAAVSTAPQGALSTKGGIGNRAYVCAVARLGAQAAEALDYAHQLGVVHRDVKPANLMVDGRGQLWVTDFGLAQLQQGEGGLTLTGDLIGTLRYMSPEQALAKRVPIDHRSDIYSLGATLYELLTLRPVFGGDSREELLRRIACDEPAPPRRLNRALPVELETIVLKALEKNPAERYATAKELADDLRHWLEDRPIKARRPSLGQRARRWARRHRPLVTGVAAALVVGLTVLAGSVGWMARDRAARRDAMRPVIAAALEESDSRQQQRRLPEALSAARRAYGLLAGAEVDEALQQQVRSRLADLELLDKLESIRVEKETAVNSGHFREAADIAAYGQTLRAADLDVETLPAEEAGRRIARSTVAVELAAVLDYWALSCRAIRGEGDPTWKKLLRIARAADPDPWRDRVRQALEKWDLPAVHQLAAAGETLRLPPASLCVIGSVLRQEKEAPGSAEAFLRESQRRHPNDFWLNHNAYMFLSALQPPKWDEAVRFAAVAVALRPDSPGAHGNLGVALLHNGRWDEALAECREVVRLKPDDAIGHSNLGVAFAEKGLWDEAIAEHRQALRLSPDNALARFNLGAGLHHKGLLDEAVAEYRQAIRLSKDFAEPHYGVGNALRGQGKEAEAVAAYRKAIELKPDYPEAHCDLGHLLREQGQFAEALVQLRRGHEFGSKNPRWSYPSAQWVQQCEHFLELDRRLSAILSGRQKPADMTERIDLAEFCILPCKKCYVAACHFYEEAFAGQPDPGSGQPYPRRYHAAWAAALAGCGQGKDADQTDGRQRAHLRQLAREWLHAILALDRRMLEKEPDKACPFVAQHMQYLQQDKDFAGVRGQALAPLPEAERAAWQQLWAGVADLLARAQAQGPPEMNPVGK
jgi:serine/threonine protein kinase/tetratricopeptide (TPR) repeat protein